MSRRTFKIIYILVLVILLISVFFPYQRFNIAIEYSKIIRITIGAVVIGMALAGFFLNKRLFKK